MGVAVMAIYFVGRWIFSTETPDAPRQPRTVPQEQIDAVLAAFPQITEHQARFDLGRSGSLETTFERVLRDGRLPDPPPGLFPPSSVTPNPTAAAPSVKTFSGPNLITRYGLQSRIEESEDIKGKGRQVEPDPAWAATTTDRQDSLKERKAKMILDARRRMIEKDRAAAHQ